MKLITEPNTEVKRLLDELEADDAVPAGQRISGWLRAFCFDKEVVETPKGRLVLPSMYANASAVLAIGKVKLNDGRSITAKELRVATERFGLRPVEGKTDGGIEVVLGGRIASALPLCLGHAHITATPAELEQRPWSDVSEFVTHLVAVRASGAGSDVAAQDAEDEERAIYADGGSKKRRAKAPV